MENLSKGEHTKINIIKCAAHLFYKNGFNATGISDILKAAQIPKGSFYFHFKSKKEVALAVCDYFEQELYNWITSTSKDRQWPEFISTFVDEMKEKAESNIYFGCPLTAIGHELAFSDEYIAAYYSKSLYKLIYLFKLILESSGIPKEKSMVLAKREFFIYEGGLAYFRISKDTTILDDMKDNLIDIYMDFTSSIS